MDNQAVLTKAISLAIDGGWSCFGTDLDEWDWHLGEGRIYPLYMYFTPNESVGLITYTSQNHDANRIIFNHGFAKALWGDEPSNNYLGIPGIPCWHAHLQQMVVAEDPIKYLGEHIDG